jgi:hypothetical protein
MKPKRNSVFSSYDRIIGRREHPGKEGSFPNSLRFFGHGQAVVIAVVAFLLLSTWSVAATSASPSTGAIATPTRAPRRIESTPTPDPNAPRAWMGIIFSPDSKYLRTFFHAPSDTSKTLVGDVIPGQPADKAGVQVGDWVVAINGHTVSSNNDVVDPVRVAAPGTVFRLTIVRNGQESTVSVRVAARPNDADRQYFDHLTDRINANEEDTLAYYLRADMWSSSQITNTIVDYSRAIELAPDFEAAYEQRAGVLISTDYVEQAASDATRDMELDPSRRGAYVLRATAYVSLGRNDEAIDDSTHALEMTKDPLAYALRGQAYLQRARQGDLQKAIEDETQALTMVPVYPFPYYIRGLAYAQLGRINEAIFDLKQHAFWAPFSQTAAAARSRLQQLTWH